MKGGIPEITLLDIYEAEYTFDEDIKFVLTKVEHGNSVLEVGCGIGRVLDGLKKSDKKLRLFGIDIDKDAIAIAREKLGKGVELSFESAHNFTHNRKYNAIVFLFNGFMHIEYPGQMVFLKNAFNHLERGGRLILSVFNPDPVRMEERFPFYKFQKTLVVKGVTLDKFEYNRYDLKNQLIHRVFNYDYTDVGGVLRRVISRFTVRYFFKAEMEEMIKKAGYVIKGVYGAFDGSKWREDSTFIIVEAERRI